MTPIGNTWLLCTRTATEDYFWIGRGTEPTGLYKSVSDETDYRCGYFLAHGGKVEIGLNRLDVDRRDNGNRRIRHSLILSAKAGGVEANFLKRAFAQAIVDTTPMAAESAAAALGMRLYAWWEKDGAVKGITPPPDWWELAKDLAALLPELPLASQLKAGCYYRRSSDTLGRLAVSVNHPAPVLLLCAATNYIGRIWPAAEYADAPSIVCALEEGRDGETLAEHMKKMRPAKEIDRGSVSGVASGILDALGKMKRGKWLLLLFAIVLAAVVVWTWSRPAKTPEVPGGTVTADVSPTPAAADRPATESSQEFSDMAGVPQADTGEPAASSSQPAAHPLRPDTQKEGTSP